MIAFFPIFSLSTPSHSDYQPNLSGSAYAYSNMTAMCRVRHRSATVIATLVGVDG
jgi:hypothetical protein